ncbi:hypothetical protein EDB80DRAFT_739088 [Ilyonectria destructans]|nr:hypothetical protein EDB80DRAFT_739088 [Ilyonectria destructans]
MIAFAGRPCYYPRHWSQPPTVAGLDARATSNKHKRWQNFAAGTAAAASQAILDSYIRTEEALKTSASDGAATVLQP